MAKKPLIDPNLFHKTEPESKQEKPPEDKTYPIGVGMTRGEAERLTVIAGELGVNRHALLLWLVRDFIRRYDSGERPPTETKPVLKR